VKFVAEDMRILIAKMAREDAWRWGEKDAKPKRDTLVSNVSFEKLDVLNGNLERAVGVVLVLPMLLAAALPVLHNRRQTQHANISGQTLTTTTRLLPSPSALQTPTCASLG
jgi:hypothetical protein